MSEPIFDMTTKTWERPERLFLSVIAAFILGSFGLTKRPPQEPDYWESEDEPFIDYNPTLRWDGHDYRPVDSWHEDFSNRSILGPEDL